MSIQGDRSLERSGRTALRRMKGQTASARLSVLDSRPVIFRRMVEGSDPACMVLLREHLLSIEEEIPPTEEQISEGTATQLFASRAFDRLEGEFLQKTDEAHRRWIQRFGITEIGAVLQRGGWLAESEGRWELRTDGSRRQMKELHGQVVQQLAGDMEKNLVVILSRSQHLQERIAKQWYGETVRGSQSRLLPTLELAFRSGEAAQLRKIRDRVGELAFTHFVAGLKKTQNKRWSTPEAVCRGAGGVVWNPLRTWESGFRGYLEDYLQLARGVGLETVRWYRAKWDLYLRGYAQGQTDLFRADGALTGG